ncbi:protein FAM167A isoform X2 [Nothobranchius furzeri]|uniref:protein FAM167A isoform X2 n=1 Tax=Nothobranchius furzeri TaxID=105023 RepID=UPI003904BCCB
MLQMCLFILLNNSTFIRQHGTQLHTSDGKFMFIFDAFFCEFVYLFLDYHNLLKKNIKNKIKNEKMCLSDFFLSKCEVMMPAYQTVAHLRWYPRRGKPESVSEGVSKQPERDAVFPPLLRYALHSETSVPESWQNEALSGFYRRSDVLTRLMMDATSTPQIMVSRLNKLQEVACEESADLPADDHLLTLKALTEKLRLQTRRPSYLEWKAQLEAESFKESGTGKYQFQEEAKGDPVTHTAEENEGKLLSGVLKGFESIDEALSWLRRELQPEESCMLDSVMDGESDNRVTQGFCKYGYAFAGPAASEAAHTTPE